MVALCEVVRAFSERAYKQGVLVGGTSSALAENLPQIAAKVCTSTSLRTWIFAEPVEPAFVEFCVQRQHTAGAILLACDQGRVTLTWIDGFVSLSQLDADLTLVRRDPATVLEKAMRTAPMPKCAPESWKKAYAEACAQTAR
ncbi:MAG: hypothetical protein IT381_04455 [Deltaproteobacteria bacterium]|nr:hypothetical protein [Deltaproteobacteria bacterium]